MIAGGSGITPLLPIIRAALQNKQDPTIISLIYGNTTEADILLKGELDELAMKYSQRFKVYYTLSKPPATWLGGVGRVSQSMISERLPPPEYDIKILMCGM